MCSQNYSLSQASGSWWFSYHTRKMLMDDPTAVGHGVKNSSHCLHLCLALRMMEHECMAAVWSWLSATCRLYVAPDILDVTTLTSMADADSSSVLMLRTLGTQPGYVSK
jgi:hypothetical protein